MPKAASKPKPKPKPLSPISHTTPPTPKTITPYQARIYAHLLCIPPSRITTYGTLAKALNSSPRAVGGALRCNPFAPSVPCHRVIASDGFVGGFKGDWEKAPSGINQSLKLKLLKEEGVDFTSEGKLVVREGVWFDGPWDISETTKVIEQKMKS
jgi:methylated-DNA-[protein]-cysteine S-methyltransferase